MTRIENTLPAFEAAIAGGFAIECDVRLTADGQLVVFHDAVLDRLTDARGPLVARSLDELRKVAVGQDRARIPSLGDLFDLVDGRVPLFIEVKAEDGDWRTAAGVAAAASTYDGPAAVMSFDPAAVATLRRLAPHIPRGMITGSFAERDFPGLHPGARFTRRHLLAAPWARPQFIACDFGQLPASAPLLMRHFLDLPLLAWTVRSPVDQAAAMAWVDQVIFEGFDPGTTVAPAHATPV